MVLPSGKKSRQRQRSSIIAHIQLMLTRRDRLEKSTHTPARPRGLWIEGLEDRRLLAAVHPLPLSTLSGNNGFRIDGVDALDKSGRSVSSAGDVNGDGFDDLIVGAFQGDPAGSTNAGESYVVFGKSSGFASSLALSGLNGTNGFRIEGIDPFDGSGLTVSGVGDINGDNFDDLLIGAFGGGPGGNSFAGESYIVFGKSGGFVPALSLSSLNGITGFRIDGIDALDYSGLSVSGAGDINGDGFDDLVVGAPRSDPNGISFAGESYVVFGKSGGFASSVSFSSLNGINGFRIDGIDFYDWSGTSVSGAGDVNGDGFDDLIIGASLADPGGINSAGASYVVFGKSAAFAPTLNLGSLKGTNGFRIDGVDSEDYSGDSVSKAGDFNGDGFDDLIVGAAGGDPGGNTAAGESYLVFGRSGGFASALALSSLNGVNGFRIDATDALDGFGNSVSSAGDVNGDGFDDLIIGANTGDPAGINYAGESYVIFGRSGGFASAIALSSLNGTNGFRMEGIDAFDFSGISVSSGGDVNGDGFDDLIVGADSADPGGNFDAGESYVIFGGNFTGGAEAQVGGNTGDALTANQGATQIDVLIGGRGNDALDSDGGPDVLIGGQGDDFLTIRDLSFRRIVGGTGFDTLRLSGSGLTLDLTDTPDNRIMDIEQIDLESGNNHVLMLTALEVRNLSSHSNTMIVQGIGSQVSFLDSGWSGPVFVDNDTYRQYTNGSAKVRIQSALATSFSAISLAELNGINGFRIDGIDAGDFSGVSVSSGGDVNGDGFDDLIVGADSADPGGNINAGESYVIFGRSGGFASAIALSGLNGTNGFRIEGLAPYDFLGRSVSSGGDVDGDGFDDLIVCAFGAGPGGNSQSGESYVIFGKSGDFASAIALSSLNGTNGFRIDGIDAYDRSGFSVSSGGDVNGDGFDDMIVGAWGADPGGNSWAGESYVIFGKSGDFASAIALSSLNGTNGFRIDGIDADDHSGRSVSGGGDVNGDGFDDLIVGAFGADPGGILYAGESYVIFGKLGGFASAVALSSLNGTNGFRIDGIDIFDSSGQSVSSGGDVNGDGFDDLIVGADRAEPGGNSDVGESYVIFGKSGGFASAIALSSLNGTNGFRVDGIDASGFSGVSVSSGGDVNGDGFDDLIVGANRANPGDNFGAGESYVIFGKSGGFASAIALGNLNGIDGFRIDGIDVFDYSGRSVSGGGDVNGDGFDDLIVGAERADPGGNSYAGESYVIFGGNFTGGVETQVSGNSADTLSANQGAAAVDVLIGGLGNDTLVSDGGIDVLIGGQGDDTLAIIDADFSGTRRILGGNGVDTLLLGDNGLTLDLTTVSDNRIVDVERISLGSGKNHVLKLTALEIRNLSSHSNTLTIVGSGSRVVLLDGGWSAATLVDSDTFWQYSNGSAIVKIQTSLTTSFSVIALGSLNGTNGFRIDGIDAGDFSGFSVSSGGDVNGDGFDDLIVGAYGGDPGSIFSAGESYVIFGKSSGFVSTLELSSLNGTNGFRIDGIDAGDYSGRSVSSAGDVNGDALDDLIVGAYRADPSGNSYAGESYVIFGKSGGFASAIALSSLNGTNGFRIDGIDEFDDSGLSVSSGGDVNGDGLDDLIVGARGGDPGNNSLAGESYVIFGKSAGFAPSMALSALNGTNGFRIEGIDAFDFSGFSVSSGGDVNGDGLDDLIVGAYGADSGGNSDAGESYVIFGKSGGLASIMALSSLDGTNGFRIDGIDIYDRSGRSVSSGGDINGDGFDDLIVGAYGADPSGNSSAGESYVIFGKSGEFASAIALDSLNGTNGFRIEGIDAFDFFAISVSSGGDVNGDGFDDLIVGASGGDPGGNSSAGESYVIFGKSGGFVSAIALGNLNDTNGLRIDGISDFDGSGRSVSSGGDVNGDGFDDLIVGAERANPSGNFDAGESYVIFGGNFTGGIETQEGGNAADTLSANQGAAAVDVLLGGLSNDTLLSDGGSDVLIGGQGDDTLAIVDVDFSGMRRLSGGNGVDTLRLDSSGLTLDLTSISDNRIRDIEIIDLTGSGDNTLILDKLEVLNISSHSNTLIVHRDVGDEVVKESGWTQLDDEIIEGDTFEVYRQGAAILKIHRLEHSFNVPGGNAADVWTVRRNGTNVELFSNSSSTLIRSIRQPLLGSLMVRSSTGEANRLDVDYLTGGFFAVPGGITFQGSTGTDDLRIVGNGLNTATFVSAGSSMASGSLLLSDGGAATTVSFTNIEPLSISGLLAMNVSGVLGVGGQTLTIDAATFAQLGTATILTGGTIIAPGGLSLPAGSVLQSSGTINASGGLHLSASSVTQASGTINAPVSSEVGSTITLTGNLTIGDASSFDGINLAGRLNIGANTLTLLDGHKAVLGSQTTLGTGVANGTLNSASGIELPDTRTFVGRGTVNTASGEFENQGFVFGNNPGLTLNHLVTGAGDFGGTVNFLGGTDFGNSPAKVDVENITLGPLNTHLVEIGGLVAGSEYDQVNASGTVGLNGALEVVFLNLANGFTPTSGNSFDIINAGTVTGTFNNVLLPSLPSGLQWNVAYHSGRVTLSIMQPAAAIVGAFVYHAGSSFAGGGIPNAIDTTKQLAKEGLTPQTLTFDNLINSSRGINGIVLDIDNLPGNVTATDFEFQMSPQGAFNSGANPPGNWQTAPTPASVTVIPEATSRVVLQWPNNAIANRWLRMTVKANASTGLAAPETYYLGHLLGETTGPTGGAYTVAFADISPIRSAVGQTVNAGSIHDIDKNGTVSFADISAMRGNVGSQLTNITIPVSGGGGGSGAFIPMSSGNMSGTGIRKDDGGSAVPRLEANLNFAMSAWQQAVDSVVTQMQSRRNLEHTTPPNDLIYLPTQAANMDAVGRQTQTLRSLRASANDSRRPSDHPAKNLNRNESRMTESKLAGIDQFFESLH